MKVVGDREGANGDLLREGDEYKSSSWTEEEEYVFLLEGDHEFEGNILGESMAASGCVRNNEAFLRIGAFRIKWDF
jgi:hypothetical protein